MIAPCNFMFLRDSCISGAPALLLEDRNAFSLRKDILSTLTLQVQFDEREDTKVCTIVINDDQVFENIESFTVELSMPVYALLGQMTHAKVNINDTEDEPTLQFDKKTYHINESSGFVFVPIERKGGCHTFFHEFFCSSY